MNSVTILKLTCAIAKKATKIDVDHMISSNFTKIYLKISFYIIQ